MRVWRQVDVRVWEYEGMDTGGCELGYGRRRVWTQVDVRVWEYEGMDTGGCGYRMWP